MEEAKVMKTPMSSSIKLDMDEKGKSIDSTMYRGMIGSLLYLTASRPDIMYSVCLCARFQSCPKESHLSAVKRILRYLKGTMNIGLWYLKGDNFELIGFSNADFAGCRVERKSTSGTCHFLGHSLVSWHSKKQNSVALSTAEVEYIAAGGRPVGEPVDQFVGAGNLKGPYAVSSLDEFGLQIWTGSSLIARHLLVLFLSRAPRAYSGWSSLFACSLQFSELISIFFGFWMAPRKETGTSRAQGKRPTEPSQQPEQTEARQKARYDTALFSSNEDYQRYKQKFAQRKVVPRRSVNFSQLQHFGFEGLFGRMGWLPVVMISEPVFPTLVRAFYSRATYRLGGPLLSTVRGVEIRLSPESICRILDIPSVGLRVYEAKVWPTVPGFEPREAVQRLCGLADPQGMGKPSAHSLTAFIVDSILTGRRIHVGYLMMMHMISYVESSTRVLPHGRFLTRAFKDVGVDLSRETDFEAPTTYDMYDEQSLGRMKFEKAPDGSWVRKAERQARGHDQIHPGVEEKAEIREMEDGLDPQRDFEQRGPKLDIPPPHQLEGIHVEATFSEPMMTESSFTAGPSSQPSFTELPSQAPHAPNHLPWMDLSAQISSLGTRMEELVVVHDTRFSSMEDRIDQYQAGFTSQFEHLVQRIERLESRQESQHEETMAYLRSVFPPPPPQP
ncbi:Retrovirus-related Pol polyprotein from transposon RE1 [Vitis vinifera]|uniref:Retrovirus-related Pol polyprotein from transposon RE1 n=1 Tax=Vitis vinifera TaxID=29760 RepID=A0A438IXE7_VITVI|nr:Retrovirus-related Pol polyprotein from transposon RE1 [Vitis vinifera]